MTKKFVLWAAVSSQPQVEKVSLDNQIAEGRLHAERWDGEVVAELIVPGESRNIVLFEEACERISAFAQLRDLIKQRSFDVFVFKNRSRLGRDAALSMAVVSLCHRQGIIPYDLEEPPHDLDDYKVTPDKLFMGALKSASGQNEILALVQRNKDGILGRVRDGEFPYADAWGWRRRYHENGKLVAIEINPQAQTTIRLIVELYLKRGWGTPAITEELNRLRHPAPAGGQWNRSSVVWILSKAWRYAGYTEVNVRSKTGRPYLRNKAKWPAIISEQEAAAILSQKKRRIESRRSVTYTYRYSQCVYCSVCGKRMTVQTELRPYKGKTYFREFLRCASPDPHDTRNISARKITKALRAHFAALSDDANYNALLDDTDDASATIEKQIEDLKQHYVQIETGFKRADDAYTSGLMDTHRYRAQVQRIKQQLRDTQAQITDLQDQLLEQEHNNQRSDRLAEVRDEGPSMLDEPDLKFANAWMLEHVRIWIRGSEVEFVKFV